MKQSSFSLRKRMASFRVAWEGVLRFFAQEHNAWIHLAATITVFIAAVCLRLSKMEVICLVVVTGLVWSAEIINTAIEKTMDFISPQQRKEVKYIKDLAAAAVLITSLVALITGAFIFIPKIL